MLAKAVAGEAGVVRWHLSAVLSFVFLYCFDALWCLHVMCVVFSLMTGFHLANVRRVPRHCSLAALLLCLGV